MAAASFKIVIILVGAIFLACFFFLTGPSDTMPDPEDPLCTPADAVNRKYDVNEDEVINYADTLAVNAHINSESSYREDYDMNCDGVIDDIDVQLIWDNRD